MQYPLCLLCIVFCMHGIPGWPTIFARIYLHTTYVHTTIRLLFQYAMCILWIVYSFSVCMSQTFAEIWCMHLRTLHGILFLTMQHAPCQWRPGQLDVSQRHPQWRPCHRQKTTGIRPCTIWLLCSLELNYWFIWPEEKCPPPDWAWFLPRFFLHFGMEHPDPACVSTANSTLTW